MNQKNHNSENFCFFDSLNLETKIFYEPFFCQNCSFRRSTFRSTNQSNIFEDPFRSPCNRRNTLQQLLTGFAFSFRLSFPEISGKFYSLCGLRIGETKFLSSVIHMGACMDKTFIGTLAVTA